MIGYKLTDCDGYTRRGDTGETHWAAGETVLPTGCYEGKPCGPGCLHFYASLEEAVLYDPIHADFGVGARLWEIEVESGETDGLKWWTTTGVKVIKEVKLPTIETKVRVAWAICLTPHESTRARTISWLNGNNRRVGAEAAEAAEAAVAAVWAAWAARAAAKAAARTTKKASFGPVSLAALSRARLILAGEWPAERYDDPLR